MTAPMCAEHSMLVVECAPAKHSAPCRCGHPQKPHEHYTWRENCSVCACPEYSNPNAPRWITAAAAVGIAVLIGGVWVIAWILSRG